MIDTKYYFIYIEDNANILQLVKVENHLYFIRSGSEDEYK